MARILFLTQVLPYPLDAGPKVHAYYMLRHLAASHEVTLVSFVRADDKPEYVEHLRQIAHAVHTVPIRRSFVLNLRAAVKGLLTGLPIVIAHDNSPEMAALLRRLTSETPFDLVHADQLSMASWGRLAARSSATPPPSTLHPPPLLDEHNAIYRLTERMAAESSGIRRLITHREARPFAATKPTCCAPTMPCSPSPRKTASSSSRSSTNPNAPARPPNSPSSPSASPRSVVQVVHEMRNTESRLGFRLRTPPLAPIPQFPIPHLLHPPPRHHVLAPQRRRRALVRT